MTRILTAIVMLAFPMVASAQTFAIPQGCEPVLTVQQRGCLMVNVWQCAADPEGDQWIGLFGQEGPRSIQRVDAEFQWVEAYKRTGTERLVVPAPDPASLTELLANGLDTFEFVIAKPGGDERNVGFDALTGLEVVIDGEPLLQTEFEGRTLSMDGTLLGEGTGRQYVSVEHRLFFYGESWDADTPDEVTDLSPVAFIYPGEAGFFASKPTFDCGVVESRFAG